MIETSWLSVPAERRQLTTAGVTDRCRQLPPPGVVRFAEVDTPRPATLLVPVIEVNGRAALIVTKRAATMHHHRNDWVFPDGRLDAGETSGQAAMREAEEELGIDRNDIELIGQLTTRGPIMTGYVIDIHIGVVRTGTQLRPDPNEVAEAAVVPLSQLADAHHFQSRTTMPPFDTGQFAPGARPLRAAGGPLPFFRIRDDEWLWGLQGEVLAELLTHLML